MFRSSYSNRYDANEHPHNTNHYYGGSGPAATGKASRAEAYAATHKTNIRLKNLKRGGGGHTECRSVSPSGSEEEIMTYNGIMRTTDVRVNVDDGHGETGSEIEKELQDAARAGAPAADAASSRTSSEIKAKEVAGKVVI